MMFTDLPDDCLYEIIRSIDIISYFKMLHILRLTKTIDYTKLKYIYNGIWNNRDHYIGGTIYNPLFKSSENGLLRNGFGLYTQYISKHKEIKTIGYWKNNDIKHYKKITTNTKSNTEHAIVFQQYKTTPNIEVKYKGGWDNYMRNGIGSYDIMDTLGDIKHRYYGTWVNNKKDGCFNEIIYDLSEGVSPNWLHNINNIYIRYYKDDNQLPLEFTLNNKIIKIIDKTDESSVEFNLKNQYTMYTACVHINRIMSYYMYKRLKRPPLCIISSACAKDKQCNCELCNYIIKNKKYLISKTYISL